MMDCETVAGGRLISEADERFLGRRIFKAACEFSWRRRIWREFEIIDFRGDISMWGEIFDRIDLFGKLASGP